MHRIDGAGHVGNMFVAEDASINRPPTEVTAAWLNAVQEEQANLVEGLGGVLDPANNAQILSRINATFAKLAGLSTQQFSAAPASGINHVMTLGQTLGNFSPSGYYEFPFWDGGQLRTGIFQWTNVAIAAANTFQFVTLPIAFPNAISGLAASAGGLNQYASVGLSGADLYRVVSSSNQTGGGNWILAIGY